MVDYFKATVDNIPILVKCRMDLLRASVDAKDEAKWRYVEEQVTQYYHEAIPTGKHIAYLAFSDGQCVGTGGACFYQVLPTYYKPTGQKAYIINMFTESKYRRQGIGTKILDLLVQEALNQGATYISLEATKAGRPLYEKYGFGRLESEMQYINETYEGPNQR